MFQNSFAIGCDMQEILQMLWLVILYAWYAGDNYFLYETSL